MLLRKVKGILNLICDNYKYLNFNILLKMNTKG